MELTIAANKDKIALIEMNTIPKRHGWDEEKFMYYADAMGYAFIDSTRGKNNERGCLTSTKYWTCRSVSTSPHRCSCSGY